MRATVASVLAMATSVSAHARVWGTHVNGEFQGAGSGAYYLEPPSNSPVKDLTSSAIACNAPGKKATSFFKAAGGDKIGVEWYHDNRNDDYIDPSHNGPIITYVAPYTEGSDGTGAIWTKIAEDGYSGGKWAVEKMRANKGIAEFVLPADLAAGKYLLRQEIIAHHESDATYDVNPNRGAQFYPACMQLEVTSGGSAIPDEDFDFQTGYKYTDAGIHFNLYSFDTSKGYSIPGPEVWTGQGGGSAPKPTTAAPVAPKPTTAAPKPTTTSAAAPVTPQPTGGSNAPVEEGETVPSPIFSSVVAAPSSTLITSTRPAPAPTGNAPAPTDAAPVPAPAPTGTAPAPGGQCRRKRSLKARKAAKAAKKAKRAALGL